MHYVQVQCVDVEPFHLKEWTKEGHTNAIGIVEKREFQSLSWNDQARQSVNVCVQICQWAGTVMQERRLMCSQALHGLD